MIPDQFEKFLDRFRDSLGPLTQPQMLELAVTLVEELDQETRDEMIRKLEDGEI